MLTVYGACAVTFMMLMYALESRGPAFILSGIAVRRYLTTQLRIRNLG